MIACSVIVAVRNGGPYLRGTLDSLLGQSCRDFEILVTDDGSTDDTAAILEDYRDRLQVVRTAGVGPAAARNLGARDCRGQYLAFCDADDLWLPSKLECQVHFLRTHPWAVGCHSDSEYIDDRDRHIKFARAVSRHPGPSAFESLLLGGNYVCFSSLMLTRAVFAEVAGFDPDPRLVSAEDYELLLRVSRCGALLRIPERLVKYRKHSTSLSAINERNYHATWLAMEKALCTCDPREADAIRQPAMVSLFNSFAVDFMKDHNFSRSRECLVRSFQCNKIQSSTYLLMLKCLLSQMRHEAGR